MSKHNIMALAVMGIAAMTGLFAEEAALPEGYTQLSWIESTGEQYIDTGINAGANTTIDMSFGHCAYGDNTTLFGKDIWNPKGFLFIMQNDHFRFFGSTGSEPGSMWNIIDKDATGERDYRFTLGADSTIRMYDAEGTELGSLATDRTVTSSHSLWLFKANRSYSLYGQYRLYSMKIGNDSGDTLRDFVPARRGADGAAGLYDRVSQSFFANANAQGASFVGSDDLHIATWTGAGDGADLAQAANWECRDFNGNLVAGGVPNQKTIVKIADVCLPSVSGNWSYRKVVLGGIEHPSTEWGRISYGVRYNNADMPDYSFVDLALGTYVWKGQGANVIDELDDYNTAWMKNNLRQSQLRFDGWVYVDAVHAGEWSILLCFDDYFHLTIDGVEIAKTLTFREAYEYTATVSVGWHRFTCICGDCWGGYGSLRWAGSSWSGPGKSYGPMTITVGGTSFKFSALTEGSGKNQMTLTQDVDWRGLGKIKLADGMKLDLAGHKLYLSGLAEDANGIKYLGTEITDSVGGGELHLDSAENWSNSSVRFSGALKLVKEGAGNYTSAYAGQCYTGGTKVAAGKFTLGNNTCLGDVSGEVQVDPGATLELNGVYEIDKYQFVLAGGTIQNTGANVPDTKSQIGSLRLTADSTFKPSSSYGLIGWCYVPTTLDLAGHTLTVPIGIGKKFWFYNVTVTAGTVDIREGGFFAVKKSVNAPNATFRINCAPSFWDTFAVGAYEALYPYEWNEGNGTMTVKNRFKPTTAYHRPALLENGATLDLSTWTEAWSIACPWGTCTFADNSVIEVDLGERKPSSGTQIIAWTEAPKNLDVVQFKLNDDSNVWLEKRSDGIYINRGFMIIVR